MSDIRTVLYRPLQIGQPPFFDWEQSGADLGTDDGLETAVIVSLFTDRRAEPDDVLPDGSSDRRGWWADAWPDIEGDRIGSRLWLLAREKDMASVVNRAREYTEEALAWLVEQGIVSRIEVMTGWVDITSQTVTENKTSNSMPGVLGIAIVIHRPQSGPVQFQFEQFWREVA